MCFGQGKRLDIGELPQAAAKMPLKVLSLAPSEGCAFDVAQYLFRAQHGL